MTTWEAAYIAHLERANQPTDCVAFLHALIDAVDQTRDALDNVWQTFADGGDEGVHDTLGVALAHTAMTTRILAHTCWIDLDRAITTYTTIHNHPAPTPTAKDAA